MQLPQSKSPLNDTCRTPAGPTLRLTFSSALLYHRPGLIAGCQVERTTTKTLGKPLARELRGGQQLDIYLYYLPAADNEKSSVNDA